MIDYTYQAGGLAGEPEIRFAPNGNGVVNFTLAQSDAKKDEQGEWETTRQLWTRVTLWDSKTQWTGIIPNLPKGTKIVVQGKWVTRQWETKDGSKRSQTEFQARDAYIHGSHIAPKQPSAAQDAWNNAAQKGQTAMTGGFNNNNEDNPPF